MATRTAMAAALKVMSCAIRRSRRSKEAYVRRVDLAALTAHADLAASKFCLANPGREYLVFLPDCKETRVHLRDAPRTFAVTWFNPETGESREAASVKGDGPVKGSIVSHFFICGAAAVAYGRTSS
jgi:hypothetical protein